MLDTIESHAKDYMHDPISSKVIMAVEKTPREIFGGDYSDHPKHIGYQQTISQPFMVTIMTDMILKLSYKQDNILEIGSGSGYQSSILSHLFKQVTGVERIPELAQKSTESIKNLGISNIEIINKNGFYGGIHNKKYDAIIVTCGVYNNLPPSWGDQLHNHGVIIAPFSKVENKNTLFS